MRNGRCNIAVEVQRASTTRDDYGQMERTWSSHVDPLWVDVSTKASEAEYVDGQSQVESVSFVTPWYDGVDIVRGDRVSWNGDTWEILTVMDRNGRREFVDITAKRVEV